MNWDERGNLDLLAASSSFKEFATRSDTMSLVRCSFVILLFVPLIATQSQPPSPTPRKTAQDNQRKTGAKETETSSNHNDADKISTAIDQLTSEVASWKKQPASTPQKDDAPADWWLKWSTIISAVATFGIFVLAFFQWRAMRGHKEALDAMAEHMRDGLVETRKAADAAKKSAEVSEMALRLTQRADILVEACSIVDNTRAGFQIAPNNHVSVAFKNFGRTRAENVVYKIRLIIPGVPESDQINGPSPLGPGDSQTMSFIPFGAFLNQSTMNDIGTGAIIMRIKGTVSYADIFGDTHVVEVLARYSPKFQIFRHEENPDPEDVGNQQ
jgi:hypothetical protein